MISKQRTTIYQGNLVDLSVEEITLANGEILGLEVMRHPGGAAILAINEMGHICLLRQYRHVVSQWIWEIPAGVIEKKEEPISAAKRELREEAGLIANEWQSLLSILPTPGFCDERLYLYSARQLSEVNSAPNIDEQIEVHWKTKDELLKMLADNRLQDAKTIIAILSMDHLAP